MSGEHGTSIAIVALAPPGRPDTSTRIHEWTGLSLRGYSRMFWRVDLLRSAPVNPRHVPTRRIAAGIFSVAPGLARHSRIIALGQDVAVYLGLDLDVPERSFRRVEFVDECAPGPTSTDARRFAWALAWVPHPSRVPPLWQAINGPEREIRNFFRDTIAAVCKGSCAECGEKIGDRFVIDARRESRDEAVCQRCRANRGADRRRIG